MLRTHACPVGLILVILGSFAVTARSAPATQPEDPGLTAAIEQLKAQTTCYDGKPNDNALLTFVRPQPFVASLSPELAPQVLERITRKITGNSLKDTYIRYHLMPAVLRAGLAERDTMSKPLMELAREMPEPIDLPTYPEYVWEPKKEGERFERLRNSLIVLQGFPPFQVTVYPPDSLALMDGQRRVEAEKIWAEAAELQKICRSVDDPDARRWNRWVAWSQWMQRQYRGEVLYAMMISGDPKLLNSAIGAIVQLPPRDAADGISFFSAAYNNGFLSQYDRKTVESAASKVAQAAVGKSEKWVEERNPAEAAFHVVRSIELGREVKPLPPPEEPDAPPPALGGQVTAATLTLEQINNAIARAKAALLARQTPEVLLDWHNWGSMGVGYFPWTFEYPYNNYHRACMGHQALACWALLAAGESHQDPATQKRIGWVMSIDTSSTYDRAMRLQTLGMLPRKGWEDWVLRDRNALLEGMTDKGNFTANYTGDGKAQGFGDNANGQYAVMGLAVAERLRQSVPPDAWRRIDNYWREAQFPGGSKGTGGWALASAASIDPKNPPGADARVSGPMTAAGILALSYTERFLQGSKRTDVGQGFSPALEAGVQWLDENFSFEGLDGDQDWFYYMWTIQNVGHATGLRTFKNIDWFREGTANLLNSQQSDGLWNGPKGDTVSTSFALLYLYRARGPLAVCKVRFTPATTGKRAKKVSAEHWNNRTHDLLNFADYVTEAFETPTSWQIASVDQPVHELMESTMLYLATDKPFALSSQDMENLRHYTQAGGMLVCVPEGSGASLASFRALAKQMYPEQELAKLTKDHVFYNLVNKSKSLVPIIAVGNGIRPMMVIFEKDIGKDLQANNERGLDSFVTLANIYQYAAGRNPRRPRLASNFVVQPEAVPARKLTASRITYTGNFDPEPMALPQLKALLARDHEIDLQLDSAKAADLSATGANVAFLSITAACALADSEITSISDWVKAGGTLWIDAAGGSDEAVRQLETLVPKILGGLEPKPVDDPAILAGSGLRNGYDLGARLSVREFAPGGVPVREPLLAATIDGRRAVYIYKRDVTCALAGVNAWQIAGLEPATARKLVINTILDLAGQ